MSTVQDLLAQLNAQSGNVQWRLVGDGTPVEQVTQTTVPDPNGIKPPQTVNRGSGKYYVVVQDNQNPPNQRALTLVADPNSAALQSPSVHQGGTTTTGPLRIRQTGVNDQDVDAAGKVTPRTDIYQGDLNKIDWRSGGPLEDIPQGAKQASPTAKLDRIDSSGNIIPPGDTTTKAVQLRDPQTGTTTDVPKDPAGTLTPIGNTMYVVKPDGSATVVNGPDGKPLNKPQDKQQLNVPGIGLVEYDPAKQGSDAYNVIVKTPTGVQPKDLQPQKVNGKTYLPVD